MERGALRLDELQALDNADRSPNRIRLQWRAVRVGEDQVEVGAVIRPVLPPEFVLAQRWCLSFASVSSGIFTTRTPSVSSCPLSGLN